MKTTTTTKKMKGISQKSNGFIYKSCYACLNKTQVHFITVI